MPRTPDPVVAADLAPDPRLELPVAELAPAEPVVMGVDVTTAETQIAIVDLVTGAIRRLTQSEIDQLAPNALRPASERDLAIGE